MSVLALRGSWAQGLFEVLHGRSTPIFYIYDVCTGKGSPCHRPLHIAPGSDYGYNLQILSAMRKPISRGQLSSGAHAASV